MTVDLDAAYRQFGPMVYRRCARLLDDEHEAIDAMQEVFVMLLKHDGEVTQLGAFLHVLATRHCLNRLRAKRRRPESPDSQLVYTIAHSADLGARSGALSTLRALFAPEPESTRVIAVLHYLDGLTLEEVAREVNMSVSGVRKRLRGLRQQLHHLEETP